MASFPMLPVTEVDRERLVQFFARGEDGPVVDRLRELSLSGTNDEMPMMQLAVFVRQQIEAEQAAAINPASEA